MTVTNVIPYDRKPLKDVSVVFSCPLSKAEIVDEQIENHPGGPLRGRRNPTLAFVARTVSQAVAAAGRGAVDDPGDVAAIQ